jgi:hypothetical protein
MRHAAVASLAAFALLACRSPDEKLAPDRAALDVKAAACASMEHGANVIGAAGRTAEYGQALRKVLACKAELRAMAEAYRARCGALREAATCEQEAERIVAGAAQRASKG